MRTKLTKRTVDSLEPGDRDFFVWDSEIPGFGRKVTPKGRRTYLLQYAKHKRDHRITLGQHGAGLTAEQARIEATRLRGLIAGGETPTSVHAKPLSSLTMTELGERYLEEYAIPHKKPAGVAQDRRNLANHIVPLLGPLLVSTIERADVARVMRDIATARPPRTRRPSTRGGASSVAARSSPTGARPCSPRCSPWPRTGSSAPRGPIPAGASSATPSTRSSAISLSLEEMARLGQALTELEREGALAPPRPSNPRPPRHANRIKPAPLAALRLLLLTGCRVGEILTLRWKDVDLDRRLLLLPDSKTGAKSVFLPEPALALLRVRPGEHSAEEFVFPGEKPGKPIISIRKPWERLCKMARIEAVRLHDLRHNFASVGAPAGSACR